MTHATVRPAYWQDDAELATSMRKYLRGGEVTVRDVARIRAYCCAWIASPVWDMTVRTERAKHELDLLRADAKRIANRVCVTAWLLRSQEAGMGAV
jgi:hypothetical protein